MSLSQRRAAHATASTGLALLSDRRLADAIADAEPLGSGIGGTKFALEVDGTPVFGKRIRLCELERRAENVMSTANLFGLPTYYQYGFGSTGFGAWRELAVHTMTTNWVLTGESESFPLTYHWRVLPGPQPAAEPDLSEVEQWVEHWGGSERIRDRLMAIEEASTDLVVFMEYVPQSVHAWLKARSAEGPDVLEGAAGWVAGRLAEGVEFMRSRGLIHFDAHFENILTDGSRLYFADFGLALHDRFELSAPERKFFGRHLASYDLATCRGGLARWLTRELELSGTTDVPPGIAEIVARDERVAELTAGLFRALRENAATAIYPAEELSTLLAAGR